MVLTDGLTMSTLRRSNIDQGYAWVILGASFFSQAIQLGIAWTVGVFFDIFRMEFEGSNGAIALISALNTSTFFMAGPLAGALTNRFGIRRMAIIGGIIGSIGLISSRWANAPWHLYITYGIIGGCGFGIGFIPSITIVGHYFQKRRMIALGIAVSGCGFGTFIFPPIIRLLVEEYGWRGGITLTGALCLNTCVCGALMRDIDSNDAQQLRAQDINKNEEKTEKQVKKDVLNLVIFKNIDYLILCVNNVLFTVGFSVIYVHLGAYARTLGCSKDEGAMLFSMIGIANCAGRVIFGLLANTKCCSPIMWYIQGLLFCGITTTLTPLAYNYPGLIACAAGFGLFSACIGPLLPQIQVDFLGMEMLSSAYGYLLVFEAVGQLSGAPIAGWLYERTQYYPASFYLGGIHIIISSVMMFYPWYRSKKVISSIKHSVKPDVDINVHVGNNKRDYQAVRT